MSGYVGGMLAWLFLLPLGCPWISPEQLADRLLDSPDETDPADTDSGQTETGEVDSGDSGLDSADSGTDSAADSGSDSGEDSGRDSGADSGDTGGVDTAIDDSGGDSGDSGVIDTGEGDTGAMDTGTGDTDSGDLDTGIWDSGMDSGPEETGALDSGEVDTGTADTGTLDTGIDTGTLPCDLDADGVDAVTCGGSDCDDGDQDVFPGADEVCNGRDDDCDGKVDDADSTVVDAPTWYPDGDGDSFGVAFGSIDACLSPAGYADNNDDCDDGLPAVHPNGVEACNGFDDDCDGNIDEAGSTGEFLWYADSDSDTFGSPTAPVSACVKPAGRVANSSDCDDSNGTNYPGATESCDGVDNDCDAFVDESGSADEQEWFIDTDEDGFGTDTSVVEACVAPDGFVAEATDCNDLEAAINPDAAEACNGFDDDCDLSVDEIGSTGEFPWYADVDLDTYGNPFSVVFACNQPASRVANALDCDDSNGTNHPGATESCDAVDNDCDTLIDESGSSDEVIWYRDNDADSYGTVNSMIESCYAPTGYVANDSDCDDTRNSVHPAATEACNGRDDDCDLSTDEAGSTGEVAYYLDSDSDTFGSPTGPLFACVKPAGRVANSADCDDTSSANYPGAIEHCDGVDNDCDTLTDESGSAEASYWFADSDGDGFGTPNTAVEACYMPVGYVEDTSDCDDSDATINPDGDEVCDNLDNDCDGKFDDDDTSLIGASMYYLDDDADGYGDEAETVQACTMPSGYTSDAGDCDDGDATVNPSQVEACDAVDNDCSGDIDDNARCPCNQVNYDDSSYLYCETSTSWTNALVACQRYNYSLVTFNDKAEMYVVDYFAESLVSSSTFWWIGLNDRSVEGTYTWISGESGSSPVWATSEPGGGTSDCVAIASLDGDYVMYDAACSSSSPYFICEAG